MKRFFTFMLAIVALQVSVMAITLKGRILDKKTKEPLIGASVIIANTSIGAITNFDGFYEITGLQAGTYNIQVSYIGYKPTLMQEIKVSSNAEQILDVKMVAAEVTLDNVMVVAKKNLESENMLLMEQKKAVLAVQSVGAKELSRKGISDAQGAVAKVSGVSKQEGVKNVVVRGLGDRYNVTTLNGFPIPSEDPEYKNISLDFFSSDIIKAVGVNKTFQVASSSDIGGANINILSKELVKDSELNIGISGGANTTAIGEDFLAPDGTNALGYSNTSQPTYYHDGTKWVKAHNFENSLDPNENSMPYNFGVKVSGGRKFDVADNPLSFYVVASFDKKYKYLEETLQNTNNGSLDLVQDQTSENYSTRTSLISLANVNYSLNNKHHLAYNLMYVHSNNQSVRDYFGMYADYYQGADDYGYRGFMRRQQTNDNTLLVNQIITDWALTNKLRLDVGASYNMVNGNEPDRREAYFNAANGSDGYKFSLSKSSNRTFQELEEKDLNVKTALSYKLSDDGVSKFMVGYNGRFLTDEFTSTPYNYQDTQYRDEIISISGVNPDLNLDSYFNQSQMDAGMFSLRKYNNTYTVDKTIHSAYADFTYALTENLIMDLGVKYDIINMEIDYDVNGGSTGTSEIDEAYFLPSLNLKWDLNTKNSLRMSISETYTVPQSKEYSPFQYTDVSFDSQGNPDLEISKNYNFDLKWDYYINPGELFSVSAFYKHITDPISRVDEGNSGGILSYRNISDKATAAGVELELRKTLFKNRVGETGENKLTLGLNGSYIYTHVDVDLNNATDNTGDQLEGAAPWIGNFDMTHLYRNENFSIMNTLVFNYTGERVYVVGMNGFNDMVQEAISTLDYVASAKIGKHFGVSLKAKNLLNPSYELTREVTDINTNETADVKIKSFKKGIDFSVGVSYTF